MTCAKKKLEIGTCCLKECPEGRVDFGLLSAMKGGRVFVLISLIFGLFLIGMDRRKAEIALFAILQKELENSKEMNVKSLVQEVGES